MSFLITLLNAIALLSVAFWAGKKWGDQNSKLYWLAFLFKMTMAAAVGFVYGHYYSGDDTWTYFFDAEKLAALGKSNFAAYTNAMLDSDANMISYQVITNQEWRSVFFVKILSVLCLITNDSYWICAAWLATISFFSCWNLHKVICKWKPQAFFTSAFAFLFFPSIAFWGSGIEKETLALSGIFFLSTSLLKYHVERRLNAFQWCLTIISFVLIWKLRYFWLAAFILVVTPALIISYLIQKKINPYVSVAFVLIAFLLVILFLPYLHPNFSTDSFLKILVENNRAFTAISNPKNIIHFHQFTPHWGSVLINSPLAFFSGLFRPFVWEAQSILGFFAALENIFLFIVTIASLANIKEVIRSKDSILFFSTILYVVVLCTFLALSTPNFGSLARYRIGFLPFFVFTVCYQNPLMLRVQEMFGVKD